MKIENKGEKIMLVHSITYNKNIQLSKHFALSEFKCPESKTVKYSDELISMLEKIFTKCPAIKKGIITSGYRTPAYSVKVGGTKTDAHTYGIACDIIFYDKANKVISPKYIACICQEIGFGGIGVMNNSIHLDVRHLGGYANKKWWGDETKNYSLSANRKDFYGYYKLSKDTVYTVLGIKVKTKKKTVSEIAKEVITGKWGAGDTRKAKLKAAGYDYNAVQKEVNKLLKK